MCETRYESWWSCAGISGCVFDPFMLVIRAEVARPVGAERVLFLISGKRSVSTCMRVSTVKRTKGHKVKIHNGNFG